MSTSASPLRKRTRSPNVTVVVADVHPKRTRHALACNRTGTAARHNDTDASVRSNASSDGETCAAEGVALTVVPNADDNKNSNASVGKAKGSNCGYDDTTRKRKVEAHTTAATTSRKSDCNGRSIASASQCSSGSSGSSSGSGKCGDACASEMHSNDDATLLALIVDILQNWKGVAKRMSEDMIRNVLRRVRPVLMSQPMLVRLHAPLNICGDIHGQISDLVEIFKAGGMPPQSHYLFLGDYVDRGKFGTEVAMVLFGLKVLYPDAIHILRGNHETDSICRIYGFFDECKRRYSVRLFKEFTDVFNCLPIAALIDDAALCMHGGLSPELRQLRQIDQIARPLVVADDGLACDLLWSDPEEHSSGWQANERGVSYTFGEDVVRRVCSTLGIDVIFRAHQVVDHGYAFFADRRLVTVFSASNYCGEFTNCGAMLVMDANCKCSFQIFKPLYD